MLVELGGSFRFLEFWQPVDGVCEWNLHVGVDKARDHEPVVILDRDVLIALICKHRLAVQERHPRGRHVDGLMGDGQTGGQLEAQKDVNG